MANIQILEQVDIFTDLKPEHLTAIDGLCMEKTFSQGQLIFAENSPSTEFYIILDGQA